MFVRLNSEIVVHSSFFSLFFHIFSFDYFVVWINAFHKFLSNHLHFGVFGNVLGTSVDKCMFGIAQEKTKNSGKKTSYPDNVQIIFGLNGTKRAIGTKFQVEVENCEMCFLFRSFLFFSKFASERSRCSIHFIFSNNRKWCSWV